MPVIGGLPMMLLFPGEREGRQGDTPQLGNIWKGGRAEEMKRRAGGGQRTGSLRNKLDRRTGTAQVETASPS